MAIKYNKPEDVPNAVLRERLNALSDAVARGKAAIADEFTGRIPAEVDRDADIVLAERRGASKFLKRYWIKLIRRGNPCPATKRPRRTSNRLPKNLYAVLDGTIQPRATVGDLSHKIGSKPRYGRRR